MSFLLSAGRGLTIGATWAALAFALSFVACSEGTEEPSETGGGSNTGGSDDSGTGGTSADNGGSENATGGSEDGQGGEEPGTDTGGSAGSPATATGGAGTVEGEVLFGFDTDVEGFALETYQDEAATAFTNMYGSSTLSWDSAEGQPDPGALKLVAGFDGYSQDVTVQHNWPTTDPQDFTGRTLRVRVKLESGFNPDPSFPGGVQFFVKTGANWTYGQTPGTAGNGWSNIETMGTWIEVEFPLEDALTYPAAGTVTDFDPSQVLAIGVILSTGSGAAESAATQPTGDPTEATFFIDSFTIE